MEAERPSILAGYRSGLRGVVGASATAYGYTLTVGPTSMLLTGAYGSPEPFEVLLFCSGAILAFALVGALAFGGVRKGSNDGCIAVGLLPLSLSVAVPPVWKYGSWVRVARLCLRSPRFTPLAYGNVVFPRTGFIASWDISSRG
jgi:hypothetical protein